MSARTAVTASTFWGATLSIRNDYLIYSEIGGVEPHRVAGVGVSALGGSASLNYVATFATSVLISSNPNVYRNTVYHQYRLTVSVMGILTSYTQDYIVECGDYISYTWTYNPPPAGIAVGPDFDVAVTIGSAGLYMKAWVEDTVVADRTSPMDFTDRTLRTAWYADSGSTVSITAGPLEHSGPLLGGMSFGVDEVLLGDNFDMGITITMNNAPILDEPYGGITNIQCSGTGEFTSPTIYSPGTGDQPEDALTSGWYFDPPTSGGYWEIYNNEGGPCVKRQGTVATTMAWHEAIRTPYVIVLNALDEVFMYGDDEIVVQYTSNAQEWDATLEQYIPVKHSDELTIAEWHVTWSDLHWRKFSSYNIQVEVDDDWRSSTNRLTGGSNATQNDERVALWAYSIRDNAWNSIPPWWGDANVLTITLDDNIDLDIPEGLLTPPSAWVGYGNVTVDSGDHRLWLVSSEMAAPHVERTFQSRFFLRMDRLAARLSAEYHQNRDWVIMLTPNMSIEETLDDPQWWEDVTAEDYWCWPRRWMELDFTSPVDANVTITISYSTIQVYSPEYTCQEHTTGEEGEWEYERIHHTATYTLPVITGQWLYMLDLALPNENFTPTEDRWMMHVDKVRFDLPAPGQYALNDWHLVLYKEDGVDPEDIPHLEKARFVRNYQWIGESWFGYGAKIDGLPTLCLANNYGYGTIGKENGLQYIRKRAHCPNTALGDRLDYAKSFLTLVNELSWFPGMNVSYVDMVNSTNNVDDNGDAMSGAFYWWDIAHTRVAPHMGSTCIGTWQIIAGHTFKINHTFFPDGKIRGIAKSEDGTAIIQNTADAVDLYRTAPGSKTLIEQCDTDIHGAWESNSLLEVDYAYEVNSIPLTVLTREYTFAQVGLPQTVEYMLDVIRCVRDRLHAVLSNGTTIKGLWKLPNKDWSDPVELISGKRPTLLHNLKTWALALLYQKKSQAKRRAALGYNDQWQTVDVNSLPGEYPTGFVSGQHLYAQTNSNDNTRFYIYDTVSRELQKTVNVAACEDRPSSLYQHPTYRYLISGVPAVFGTDVYNSYDDGTTWTFLRNVNADYCTFTLGPTGLLVGMYAADTTYGSEGVLSFERWDERSLEVKDTAIVVGPSDNSKCAIVATESCIQLFGLRTGTWTTAETPIGGYPTGPAIVEYQSVDDGQTFHLIYAPEVYTS